MRLPGRLPFEPSYDTLRRRGMIHFLAVGAALGGATLVALIDSGIAWPLGAFVATATYLALAILELTVAKRRRCSRRSRRLPVWRTRFGRD